MSSGQNATFDFLAKTENEAAVDILIAGLDSPDQSARQRALHTLMERRSPAGHQEVFRRLATFDENSLAIINERPDRLESVVGSALKDPDPQACKIACDAILSCHLYVALPALVSVLSDPENPNTELAAATALNLTELFYAELSGAEDQSKRKNQEAVRIRITSALEDGVRKFHRHQRTEIIEALLVVAKSKNVALRRLLQRPDEKCHEPIIKLLSGSSRGGVIRLLLGFLDDPQMPRSVAKVISSRCDLKFVNHLLRAVGPRPSKSTTLALGKMDSIAWAEPGHEAFEKLGNAAQEAAVQTVLASGMDREKVLELIGFLLLEGKPGGRRAAAQALARFDGPAAATLAIKAINDEDPQVRAHLLVQLRPRGIPGAFSLLIRMVDSPHELVREALRKALPEFTFRQFLANFDKMPEVLQPVAGHMVSKIDIGCAARLTEEMEGPSPVRRRRAVQVADAMGLVAEMEDTVIKLLSDHDHIVRVAVAKALSHCKSVPTWEALRDALLDRSVIVQEAAEGSLERISQSLLIQRAEFEEETGEPAEEIAP